MYQLTREQYTIIEHQLRNVRNAAQNGELQNALHYLAQHDWTHGPCSTQQLEEAPGAFYCSGCSLDVSQTGALVHLASDDHLGQTLAPLQQGSQGTVVKVASEVIILLHQFYRQLLQLVHDARELNTLVSQEQQPDQAQVLQQKQKDFRWSCEQAKELWRQYTQRDELLSSLLQDTTVTGGAAYSSTGYTQGQQQAAPGTSQQQAQPSAVQGQLRSGLVGAHQPGAADGSQPSPSGDTLQPWSALPMQAMADLSLSAEPSMAGGGAAPRAPATGRGKAPVPANSTSNRLKSVLQTVLPCNVAGLFPESHQQLLRLYIDPHLLTALANLAGFYCMNACAACESRFDGSFVDRARAKVAHYQSVEHFRHARDFLRHSQSKLNRQMSPLELMMRAKAVKVMQQVESMLQASRSMAQHQPPAEGEATEPPASGSDAYNAARELFLQHTQVYNTLVLELMALLDNADTMQQQAQQQQAQQQQAQQQQQQQGMAPASYGGSGQAVAVAPAQQVPVMAAAVPQQVEQAGQEQYMYQQVWPGTVVYQQVPAGMGAAQQQEVYYSYNQGSPGMLQPVMQPMMQPGMVMVAAGQQPGPQQHPGAYAQRRPCTGQQVGRLMTPSGVQAQMPMAPPGLQLQHMPGQQLELAPAGPGQQMYAYAMPEDQGQYMGQGQHLGAEQGMYDARQMYLPGRQPGLR